MPLWEFILIWLCWQYKNIQKLVLFVPLYCFSSEVCLLELFSESFWTYELSSVTVNLEGLVKKGAMTQDQMNKALSLLKGVLDYSEFKDVDMVVEVGQFNYQEVLLSYSVVKGSLFRLMFCLDLRP